MFRIFRPSARTLFLATTLLLSHGPSAMGSDGEASEPKAKLAVLVHARTGMPIGTWRPYPGNPWLEHNPAAVNAWVNNQEAGRLYMPPSAASAIGSEIHEAIEMKRRKNALGPYWDSLDQDALDDRLMKIMRCHRPRQLLTEDATVKDMKFFGAAKAGYLAKYTPGSVVVVEAMMGFSPELDMIRVRVDESIWRYPFRAKSKRDLKRLGKDRAAAHEPVVTTVATHLYEYQMQPPPPAGSSSVLMPDAPAPADPEPYFKQMGALWRANDSAALKEHLEKAFTFVADSMRQRNGSDCD